MSEQTKPSAGALRAATACFNLPYGSAPTKSTADWTVGQMAHIIDRETGLVPLLEAAKQVMSDVSEVILSPSDRRELAPETIEMLEQAIAKAEVK